MARNFLELGHRSPQSPELLVRSDDKESPINKNAVETGQWGTAASVIIRQKAVIRQLVATRSDTTEAWRLLHLFVDIQDTMLVHHRDMSTWRLAHPI